MNQPYGYIYLIIDHLENINYVGQRALHRETKKCYYGSGTIIRSILKERGTIHLEKRILGYCDSQEELDVAEAECIYFYRAYGADGKHYDEVYGYNKSRTARGGDMLRFCKDMDAYRQKASIHSKKNWQSQEYRNKLIPQMRKRFFEIQPWLVIKELWKDLEWAEWYKNNYCIGNKNPMYGKSIYNVWLKKYGAEEANRRYNKWLYGVSQSGHKNKGKIRSIKTKAICSINKEEDISFKQWYIIVTEFLNSTAVSEIAAKTSLTYKVVNRRLQNLKLKSKYGKK